MISRTPLDDVEFLAGSSNRVAVLERLADGARTRRALHEETSVSQPTLGRILGGFEERGWIERAGQEYRITRLGSLVMTDLRRLLDTVEVTQRLATVGPHLPTDCIDFDLRLLADARLTVPEPPDVYAHLRRGGELVQGASEIRFLGRTVNFDTLSVQRELILDHGQRQEIVLATDAFEALVSHPDAVSTVRDLLPEEGLVVYTFDGEIPVGLGIIDDLATIAPYDDGTPCALLETGNETVYEWVSDTIEWYRERSTQVTLEDLPDTG